MTDKCQTGVMLTTCDSPTDDISDYTLIAIWSLWIQFSSVTKMMLTSFGWHRVLHGSSLHSALSTNISQGSVATHLRYDGMFTCRFSKNSQLGLAVKKLKISKIG